MTNNLELLRKEPIRVLEALVHTDPTKDEYGVALRNLGMLSDLMPLFTEILSEKEEDDVEKGKVLKFECDTNPAPVVVDYLPGFVEDELSAKSEVKGHPDPVGEPGEPGLTKEIVRERLATLSNQHANLDVAAIMAEMGFSKLSDIPAARYLELLQLVEKAVGE